MGGGGGEGGGGSQILGWVYATGRGSFECVLCATRVGWGEGSSNQEKMRM